MAINDPQKYQYSKEYRNNLQEKKTYIKAADIINKDKEIDIVNLQHVFSLFGEKWRVYY